MNEFKKAAVVARQAGDMEAAKAWLRRSEGVPGGDRRHGWAAARPVSTHMTRRRVSQYYAPPAAPPAATPEEAAAATAAISAIKDVKLATTASLAAAARRRLRRRCRR